MANRFWVGNAGDWNNTAHWSTTSGGASGAAVPTTADDVFFDANSFSIASQTVTVGTGVGATRFCKSINWTGVTNSPTFSGTNNILQVTNGSITFVSAMTLTNFFINVLFTVNNSTCTITTAGKTVSGVQVVPTTDSITGCVVNLSGNLTSISEFDLNITGGAASITFNTNNYNITVTGAIYVNADWTFNAGTSVITASTDIDMAYSGATFNRLSAASASFVISGTDSTTAYFFMSGSHSIGSLNLQCGRLLYPYGTVGTLTLAAGKTYTISSGTGLTLTTLNAMGTAGNLITITAATAQTFSKSSGVVSCDYLSLTNIVAAGGATWYAGSHSTNGGGNTGWLFSNAPAAANSKMLMMFM